LRRTMPVWLAVLLLSAAWAQTPSSADVPQKPRDQPAATEAHKISPQEAKDLFHQVDEILRFASQDTGFPIKHSVKRRLTSRDEVEGFLQKSLSEDKDAQRLRRSELVLKKFGLVPRDFDLQKFLVALLKEQVAGYYDPKTKTVNLLDWIPPVQQRPVLAHELTHALQDQSFGLRHFMKDDELADTDKPVTQADIEDDEISTARQAVVEGQAMAVLVDYTLAPSGMSIKDAPQVLASLKEQMLSDSDNSPELRSAPTFLREALIFPYNYGLDFTVALLTAGGKAKAFPNAFTNPPTSSRQIMEPDTYLSGERIEPLPLPDLAGLFKDYQRFDVGAMGEFDVSVLIEQYAGKEAAHRLYPHWRGGYYYAAQPKDKPSAPLAILYLSRWSNAEHAAEFAAIYANSLGKRYEHAHALAEGDKAMQDAPALVSLTGTHTWQTEEGPVVIEVKGDMVLVTESLDKPTTERIEQSLFPVAAK